MFIPGDLILRRVVGNMRSPSWEGPYRVTSIVETGAYWLEDLDEVVVPQPWNANNLRKYYC